MNINTYLSYNLKYKNKSKLFECRSFYKPLNKSFEFSNQHCHWTVLHHSLITTFLRALRIFIDEAYPSHTRISFAFVYIILGLTALYGYEFIIKLFQSLNANVAALKSRTLSYLHTENARYSRLVLEGIYLPNTSNGSSA